MDKISTDNETVLVLLDIRSVQNTASLFRTADCAGIKKIYLVGTTPTPLDRFNRARSDFSKVSLGAEKSVTWEHVPNGEELITALKSKGYKVVALEQDEKSIDYKECKIEGKTSLLLGTEVSGVPRNILEKCDAVIEIPMMGEKESLNVSVAGAIALFRILNI